MPFNFGDIPLILQELRRYFASKAQGTLADSALQPGAIGTTVQAYHARLDSLSGITNADGGIEKTGANTYGRYALTAFGKSLVDDADASTARSTLGLTIGSAVQAWDTDLDALAAISTTGPIERTGPGTWAVSDRVRTFGGNGSDGDFATGVVGTINTTGATNLTLTRETYYFRNFTINAGHTVILSAGVTDIYCSGTVNIAGTLTVNTALAGGRNVHEGGVAGSGISFTNQFSGLGIGTSRGQVYSWLTQPCGSSGTGPNFFVQGSTEANVPINGGVGGAGGGAVFLQAAGEISVANTGMVTAVGGNAATATVSNAFMLIGGSGGGSGGLVHMSSLVRVTTAAGSVINVSGGNGAAGQKGASATSTAGGGNAGGGGWIVLIAPAIVNNGTMTVAPGTKGANVAGTDPWWRGNAGASFAGLGGGDVLSATPPAAQSGILVTRLIKPVA